MNDYLNIAINNFNTYKGLADKAIAQLSEDELHRTLADDDNSVAIIMQHMIGNARSRFTDFFTTDGEKPNRNRDEEFLEKNNLSLFSCPAKNRKQLVKAKKASLA